MMSTPLNPQQVLDLLASQPTRGGGGTRGPKVDLTETREINIWFKLNHHLCSSSCTQENHRPNGRACWNPDCIDPRPTDDRGTNVVAKVKDQWICRYCFLMGYLK